MNELAIDKMTIGEFFEYFENYHRTKEHYDTTRLLYEVNLMELAMNLDGFVENSSINMELFYEKTNVVIEKLHKIWKAFINGIVKILELIINLITKGQYNLKRKQLNDKLDELADKVAEGNAEIVSLKINIDKKDSKIADLGDDKVINDNEIRELRKLLDEKKNEVFDLKKDLNKRGVADTIVLRNRFALLELIAKNIGLDKEQEEILQYTVYELSKDYYVTINSPFEKNGSIMDLVQYVSELYNVIYEAKRYQGISIVNTLIVKRSKKLLEFLTVYADWQDEKNLIGKYSIKIDLDRIYKLTETIKDIKTLLENPNQFNIPGLVITPEANNAIQMTQKILRHIVEQVVTAYKFNNRIQTLLLNIIK